MTFKKTLFYAFMCLILTMAATSVFWYGYPNSKLSFFLSGNGNAWIDVVCTDNSDLQKTALLYPKMSSVPELYTVTTQCSSLKSLSLKISHYQGSLSISDVFLSGTPLTDLHLSDSTASIRKDESGATILDVSEPAELVLCTDCHHPQVKCFKPIYFILCFFIYLILCAIVIGSYLFRDKIKKKLLTFYTLKNYSLILPYAKPYWARALLAVLITIPVGLMDAVIAWSLKPFMDVVLIEQQFGWTMYIPLMIIIFSVLQALFTYVATYMNTWVGNRIAMNIKKQLFNKLLHNDAAFFDKTNSGEILFHFNNDAESACSGLLNSMKLFTTRFFSSLSLIMVLFYNSWQLAIIAVVIMFGALYPLTIVRKRLKKAVTKDTKATAALLAHYNEAFSGNRVITSYNLFDYYTKKFTKTANGVFQLSLVMLKKTGIISPIMHFISSFGIAFVIWFGSYLIVTHQITVGNFASFITSLVMLYNPIKSIGNNYNGIIFSLMAVQRVFSCLNAVNAVQNTENPLFMSDCKGNIVYKNVSFAYNPQKEVLKNINLTINAGQTIALVGNSGGGKTTISTLLPRFYDVTDGSIEIDGVNIKNYNLNNLRDNIAIVFQDNFLFGGTIRENILFGSTNISKEKLEEAVNNACLTEFIASLSAGLDTQIGERGIMLSGGQKQRIAIARAFIKNAPILILDEATSALDNKSEAVVQQAINNLMKDRTVLIIAHRLSTVRNADCIVVLNNGEIVEKGTHEELLAKEGEYAALYKTQLV